MVSTGALVEAVIKTGNSRLLTSEQLSVECGLAKMSKLVESANAAEHELKGMVDSLMNTNSKYCTFLDNVLEMAKSRPEDEFWQNIADLSDRTRRTNS